MGDGINDAPAMKTADVSISVDTAVDIAKESANIILLEKDLNVLATGVVEGRKTYANMNKYIKMTLSSNFGNIFSILIAAIILPFVPLLATQILFLNLVYDIICGTIPWDKVDNKFIQKPRKFNTKSIIKFMLWFGPTSSIVDILAFVILNWLFIPKLYPNISPNSFRVNCIVPNRMIHNFYVNTKFSNSFYKNREGYLLFNQSRLECYYSQH
nr:cation transporting ATPase C-terminal domain-containing protein [Mycoplasmopsis bovis]